MSKLYITIAAFIMSFSVFCANAQKVKKEIDDKYVENDVVSLAGKKGFSFSTKAGDFLFKPYALVQAGGTYNRYDSQGLESHYAKNVANSGFFIPNAILGFTGKAFNKVTFNLSLNAAKSGGALLQQAWFDVALKESFRIRAGKFKTPFMHGYLSTLGETLFPVLPTSATASVLLPYDINYVIPNMSTGFDLGIQVHGLINDRWNYQVGIFNGTGIDVNTANKTNCDDHEWLPSLLYAGRLAFMPKGEMPMSQGTPENLTDDKMSIAVSASYNAEAEFLTSSDTRVGLEFAWIKNRWYFAAEAYYMNMHFTKIMQKPDKNFWGAYAQAGYFITDKLQGAFRYDFYDRNGTDEGGLLNMPAVGVNYYFFNNNLKLQVMYQYLGRTGHATQNDRDDAALGLARHSATALLQFTF
ncbi:MAG: porin [Parabacteroides sp.]|nr:porin [Parabacteroides sp.]